MVLEHHHLRHTVLFGWCLEYETVPITDTWTLHSPTFSVRPEQLGEQEPVLHLQHSSILYRWRQEDNNYTALIPIHRHWGPILTWHLKWLRSSCPGGYNPYNTYNNRYPVYQNQGGWNTQNNGYYPTVGTGGYGGNGGYGGFGGKFIVLFLFGEVISKFPHFLGNYKLSLIFWPNSIPLLHAPFPQKVMVAWPRITATEEMIISGIGIWDMATSREPI